MPKYIKVEKCAGCKHMLPRQYVARPLWWAVCNVCVHPDAGKGVAIEPGIDQPSWCPLDDLPDPCTISLPQECVGAEAIARVMREAEADIKSISTDDLCQELMRRNDEYIREALEKTVKEIAPQNVDAEMTTRWRNHATRYHSFEPCRACVRMGTCTRDAKGCGKWRAIDAVTEKHPLGRCNILYEQSKRTTEELKRQGISVGLLQMRGVLAKVCQDCAEWNTCALKITKYSRSKAFRAAE